MLAYIACATDTVYHSPNNPIRNAPCRQRITNLASPSLHATSMVLMIPFFLSMACTPSVTHQTPNVHSCTFSGGTTSVMQAIITIQRAEPDTSIPACLTRAPAAEVTCAPPVRSAAEAGTWSSVWIDDSAQPRPGHQSSSSRP